MPASNRIANSIDVIVLILVLAFMIYGIGDYALYEPHETHFAMVAKEMLLRGDWITPHLNGSPYLNKPPLLYWLIAIATFIFGDTEFAARLPLVLAGWLGIVVVWQWSRQLWGMEAGRIALVMLSVSLGWFIFTHQILIDVLLGTILIASNYFLWKFINKTHSWVYFFCFYSSVAIAFLAKGFIGVAFISCSYFCLSILHRKRKIWQRTKLPLGVVFILVLILPWAIAIEKSNPGFWHYFIVNEHFNRVLDLRIPPDYEVSKTSAISYLGLTAVWCLPWSLFFPATFQFTWQQWRKNNHSYKLKTNQSKRDAILLLAIAFLLPIVIFLPLSSRLIYYSLPAIPPYIILCAGFFSQALTLSNRLLYGSILILIGILFSCVIVAISDFRQFLPTLESGTSLIGLAITVAIVLSSGYLISGIGFLQKKSNLSLFALVISFVITYFAITIGLGFNQYIRSGKSLVGIAENHLRIDTLWIFEGSREIGAAAGISYYLNQGKQYTKSKIFIDDIPRLPTGWLSGKKDVLYRNILVLEDGGNNRLPPQFPGTKPNYLINKQQLQAYWDSDRPVVFVTDFLRQSNNLEDPLNSNLPQPIAKPLFVIGQRRLYVNQATRKILNSQSN